MGSGGLVPNRPLTTSVAGTSFRAGVLNNCQGVLKLSLGKKFTGFFLCIFQEKSCGPYPQYGWHFPEEIPEKFRKDPGNALRAFPGIPVESTAGMPQTL